MRRWLALSLVVVLIAIGSSMQMPAIAQATDTRAIYRNFARDRFDLITAEIPMRDGIKLHTVIARPRHAAAPLPILYELTPYEADKAVSGHEWFGPRSPRLDVTLGSYAGELADDGYIFVFQDIRGKFRSEGETRLYPTPRQAGEPTTRTSVSTDIYDSIEWLLRHVDGNNGRVGVWGTSYSGRTAAEALLLPHPAMKAVLSINPVVDLWMGDDFYHQGAFRLGQSLEWIWDNQLDSPPPFPFGATDSYAWYLNAGPAADFERRWFEQPLPLWASTLAEPAYADVWKRQALDKLIAVAPAEAVAVLHVHSWFDQEDNYGAPALYAAREKVAGHHNYFVAGPWAHAQSLTEASALGPFKWEADTSKQFQRSTLLPFLRQHLKGHGDARLPEARVFETGANRWRDYPAWPPKEAQPLKLFLQPDAALAGQMPVGRSSSAFVSDPAKPVPYRPTPIAHLGAPGSTWSAWLVDDQRFATNRPDVLSFVSEPLAQDMVVVGGPRMELVASTSGTDADWVVKLIDVYPDEVPGKPQLGGYQLMVSADIQRGRYRTGFDRPVPLASGEPLRYSIAMPQLNHRFRKGHRMMVQIQSSWFPLYDRNPQRFVSNIHAARVTEMQRAEHRIYHGGKNASYLSVHVVRGKPLPCLRQRFSLHDLPFGNIDLGRSARDTLSGDFVPIASYMLPISGQERKLGAQQDRRKCGESRSD